jgi:hypothetical protein
MCHLEADYQSEAKAGDTYQCVTYYINHGHPSACYVSRVSSSIIGITESVS